ncbi:anti-sigma factor family protein [Lelliottia amnigena]
MKSLRFAPPYDDDAIVAWLDGEMDRADAQAFEQQLNSDEQLATRTAELMKSNQDYPGAFAPLLDDAPTARMQAKLDAYLDDQSTKRAGVSRRALIAASLSFLVIGSGLGYLVRPSEEIRDENGNIRDLEAQYMSLYSAETLLDLDSSPSVLQKGLARTAQDIGLHVNEEQLALQSAELKMVRILRYESTSIAQIAWIHADYGPMALCISPLEQKSRTEITRETRHGMNVAWWNSRGYQFVLIGRNPASQLQDSARQLHSALS